MCHCNAAALEVSQWFLIKNNSYINFYELVQANCNCLPTWSELKVSEVQTHITQGWKSKVQLVLISQKQSKRLCHWFDVKSCASVSGNEELTRVLLICLIVRRETIKISKEGDIDNYTTARARLVGRADGGRSVRCAVFGRNYCLFRAGWLESNEI